MGISEVLGFWCQQHLSKEDKCLIQRLTYSQSKNGFCVILTQLFEPLSWNLLCLYSRNHLGNLSSEWHPAQTHLDEWVVSGGDCVLFC